ncbi:MAG: mammalian cell entry protein [Gammaproteobacteria bacterium]|nr:mammalian cell entry protein [Gammaproteobacteria bacterium]
MAEPPPSVPDDLPRAVPDRSRRRRLPLVWILPAVVILAGAFVAIQQKLAQGPGVDIYFLGADGIEANKTKIRYKDVEIGEVTDIHVSKDRKKVIVTARIHRDASDYLVQDTRFWVVRPRFAGGSVSGLGTLVSGVYISVDVGRSNVERRSFEGLEVPPIVTSDLPGREFILHADDIGSLTVGSTVYYRHISAGQVVAYALDPGGASVTIKVFVYKPYDSYVTPSTRFWQASGIDMSVDSEGVKLRTESLTSILEGGVAFQALATDKSSVSAPADTEFTLYTDRERATRQAETEVRTFIMYFKGSLRGLSVGALVDLRGITIGEVKSVSVEYERDAGTLRFPVEVDIFPQRIRGLGRHGDHPLGIDETSENASRALVDSLVAHGMRAEIKTGSLLTGQKYVAMDFHTEAPRDHVGWNSHPAVFPTAQGALDEIQDSVGSILKKLDKVPLDQISAKLIATMASLDETLKNADHLIGQFDGTIAPQISATLQEARDAMKNAKDVLAQDAPLQSDLRAMLVQLSRAAKSANALVDYLERHPESLLRGKPGDPK